MKIADTVICDDFFVYCISSDDVISLTIIGSGDVFRIQQKCSQFLSDGDLSFDWDQLNNLLLSDYHQLNDKINDAGGIPFKTYLKDVTFTNQFGNSITGSDWFTFSYSLGWKFYSNEPKCYSGDHLIDNTVPTCRLQCGDN